MNKQEVNFLWRRLGEALDSYFKLARKSVTIVAPYVKKSALERILLNVNTAIEVQVITRWEVDEIAAGVSDTSIIDIVKQREKFRVFLLEKLHAKLYLIDDRVACLGSANVTNAALGWSELANFEVMAIIEPAPVSLSVLAHRLLCNAVEATDDLRKTFQDAADLRKGCLPPPISLKVPLPDPQRVSIQFPSMRSPEKLFSAYSGIYNVSSKEEREAALNDLAALDLPDGLDESSFKSEVGKRLLQVPEVAEFDVFVLTPRRFGALTDWAKEKVSNVKRDHKASQRFVQCLIRWLRYFLPGRYVLAEPEYSEIFGRTPMSQP